MTLAAGRASADCSITGATQICGSPVTLCGPIDAWDFRWTFPDGSTASDPCITASTAGVYSLSVFDGTNWSAPCTTTITSTPPPAAPAIAGPSNGCTDNTVSLCGPDGFGYQWTGPFGFFATSSCVNVSNAGSYQLKIRTLPDGCWSTPTTQVVTFADCSQVQNCPRPAWWWSAECPSRDRRGNRIDANVLLPVADCVSSHAPMLNSTDAGFCSVMQGWRRSLRTRAIRQTAAVWANVCAGQAALVARNGQPIALDPSTHVSLPSYTGTVASFLDFASSELTRLNSTNDRIRTVRDSYRSLIRTAWNINHGLGIGPTCYTNPPASNASTSPAAVDDMDALLASGADPEPLSTEIMDDLDGPLTLGTFEPNPFSSSTRLAFAISTASPADVTIGVYDISGRLVRQLTSGTRAPGQYEITWDGRKDDGAQVRSGLYFVMGRIGGQQVQTRVTFVH
ncbi:MAG TPA: FlgD immunoglobulin-like domain containing protein [Candidatus Sulfotelmatobacter sp.]|nr:FlgD immunoglobulin-like domain containing protein [Candidatus Sulfotelmatobacter sp.]